jgi:hypothetical protein
MGQAVAFQIKSFTFAGKHIYQDIRMKKVFKLGSSDISSDTAIM